jgi:hypothetical protein
MTHNFYFASRIDKNPAQTARVLDTMAIHPVAVSF